jgi:hypothetical protein
MTKPTDTPFVPRAGLEMKRRTLIPVTATATVGGDQITNRVRLKTGQKRPARVGGETRTICFSGSTDDLERIDALACEAGLNRSAYLIMCALACAGETRAELEQLAWATRGRK